MRRPLLISLSIMTTLWVMLFVLWGMEKPKPCPAPEPADPHFSPQSWNHSRIEIEFVELPMECPKGRNCL